MKVERTDSLRVKKPTIALENREQGDEPAWRTPDQAAVLALQRTIGNRQVCAILGDLAGRDPPKARLLQRWARNDPAALPGARTEELFQLYLARQATFTLASGASYERGWVLGEGGTRAIRAAIVDNLEEKRRGNRIDDLDYFLEHLSRIAPGRGGRPRPGSARQRGEVESREGWLYDAVHWRIEETEQDQARAVGEAARSTRRIRAATHEAGGQPRPLAEVLARVDAPLLLGGLEGLRRELDEATQRRVKEDVTRGVELSVVLPAPLTAGILVGILEELGASTTIAMAQQIIEAWSSSGETRELAEKLLGPEGAETAYLLGLDVARKQTRELVEALTGSPVSVAFELGRLLAPLVLDIAIGLLTGGAGTAARRAGSLARLFQRFARRLRRVPLASRRGRRTRRRGRPGRHGRRRGVPSGRVAVAGSTVRIARELPRGGQLKLLANGRIILCHSPCAYLELRYAREFGASGPDATGWRARLVAIEERERVAIATGNTAAEEAAFDEAVALERDVREAHRLYLGTDVADAGGRFRSLEADAAEHIEWNLGRPIERLDPEGNPNHRGKTGDWFDPARGQSYDAVGPSPRFDFAEFTASIEDHATKGGLDFVFVDLSGFTPQQQQRVIAFIRGPGLAPHLARTRRPFIKVFLSHERGLL